MSLLDEREVHSCNNSLSPQKVIDLPACSGVLILSLPFIEQLQATCTWDTAKWNHHK